MKKDTRPDTRVNHQITAQTVRVIGSDGEQIGILDVNKAQDRARSKGLDLVEIAPDAVPPVCRIVDYNKFKYDQKKAQKEQEKKQRENRTVVKEIQLRPNTDTHDVEIKTRKANEFLNKGNHVRFVVKFRGRELSYTDKGKELLDKVLDILGEVTVERELQMSGRNMTLTVSPAKV